MLPYIQALMSQAVVPMAEAILLLFLLIVGIRVGLPIIFDFRSRIQSGLEETYEAHIKELKEMIDTQRESSEMCKERLMTQGKQLRAINARLSVIQGLVERYACDNAPECERRAEIPINLSNVATQSVCDFCEQESCTECDYAHELE